MRAQHCMDFLRPILNDALYMEVRTAVCQWDTQTRSEAAAANWALQKERKVG
jgi:hypothetical protein